MLLLYRVIINNSFEIITLNIKVNLIKFAYNNCLKLNEPLYFICLNLSFTS